MNDQFGVPIFFDVYWEKDESDPSEEVLISLEKKVDGDSTIMTKTKRGEGGKLFVTITHVQSGVSMSRHFQKKEK
jgi:hypothetical protein